jgi:thioredoxin 1
MPLLDTPITTDDNNLAKVFAQNLPILLLFHKDDMDKPLLDAVNKEAKRNAGELLIVRMNARENQNTYRKYGEPPTPSLVALTANQKVKSDAAAIRPADVRNHIQHLLKDTPLAAKENKSANGTNKPLHVNSTTFRDEVLKSKQPVLVDFWADWCGPCHQIAPYIDKLAQEFGSKIKVVKLDIDANQPISKRYGVQSIPTMMIFEGGQPADKVVGANPTALRKMVERYTK